jgi:hypothetical protein
MLKRALSIALVSSGVFGATYSAQEPRTIDFARDVQPIFRQLDRGASISVKGPSLLRDTTALAEAAYAGDEDITGVHGTLQPVLKARPAAAVAYVPLLEVWRGLETELQRVCAARAEVWMWRQAPVNAVPRATT